jgi:hypothetical protein
MRQRFVRMKRVQIKMARIEKERKATKNLLKVMLPEVGVQRPTPSRF